MLNYELCWNVHVFEKGQKPGIPWRNTCLVWGMLTNFGDLSVRYQWPLWHYKVPAVTLKIDFSSSPITCFISLFCNLTSDVFCAATALTYLLVMATQRFKFDLTQMFQCCNNKFSPQKNPLHQQTNKFALDYLDILPETGCGTHDETTGCPKMWWPHTAASRHIDLLCWYTASKGTGSGWAASSHLLCGLWDIDSPQAVSDSPVVRCSPAVPCAHGMTFPIPSILAWGHDTCCRHRRASCMDRLLPSLVLWWFCAGGWEQPHRLSSNIMECATVDIF